MKEIAPNIVIDQTVRFGKPVIKDTRVTVEEVLGYLAGGMQQAELEKEYGITKDAIEAVILFDLEQSWEDARAGKCKLLRSLKDLR